MKIIQTFWSCEQIPHTFKFYQNTWKLLFNDYNCFNDTQIDQHFKEYCKTFDESLCFVQLPTKIQKIDLWRYIYIYMYGGLYVDIDIAAKYPIILLDFEKYNAVLFKESPDIFSIQGIFYLMWYWFSDHPRFYQFRQSIYYSKKHNKFLKLLIDTIITRDPIEVTFPEPRFTFELTGPAVFTDIMKHSSYLEISYIDSKKLIDYHSTGSWRQHFNPLIYYISILQYIIIFLILFIFCSKKKKSVY